MKFKGNIEECARHFGSQFLSGSSKRTFEVRKAIGPLLGLSELIGKRWFQELRIPGGENQLKMRAFLAAAGYELTDLPQTSPNIEQLGTAIGLGAISLAEVAERLGMGQSGVSTYLLRGRRPSSNERQETIAALAAEHAAERERRMTNLRNGLEDLGLVLTQQKNETALKPSAPKPENGTPSTTGNLQSDSRPEIFLLAQLINAATPLATRVASEEFSARDRHILRQLTKVGPSHNVFELSNVLSECCGETARAQLQTRQ